MVKCPCKLPATPDTPKKVIRNPIRLADANVGVNSVQGRREAQSVFKVVGAMFNLFDQHMVAMQRDAK